MGASHVKVLAGRLQRFLRLDLRYAATGGFFLTLTQVTSAFVSLALTLAFANLLPIETYGTYRYALSVYALLAIAALPGIDTALLQTVSRGNDGVLSEAIRTKFKWSLLGALASLCYAAFEFSQANTELGYIFILIAIALPLMEPLTVGTSFLNGKRRFKEWAYIEIGTQIVSIASLVGTMLLTKDIVFLLVGYFAPYILTRMFVVLVIVRRYAENKERDPGMHGYGRSMTGFQVLSRMIASADQIVLFHMLGPAQVAIFSLATALPNRIQSVLRITGTLAFPKFAQRTSQEIAESLPRKMLLFALGITGVIILYILVAPLLFTYIFPQYQASTLFSQVAVFFVLSSITYPFGAYLGAHKKIREQYIIAITGFIAKILCLFIFVPFVGIWGAVIGLLVTAVLNIGFSFGMLWRTR